MSGSDAMTVEVSTVKVTTYVVFNCQCGEWFHQRTNGYITQKR